MGSNGKVGKSGRRGPRRSARSVGGRRVLAGRGDGWELWVPEDDWRRMTDQERAALVERQAALLQPSAARSAIVAGAGLGVTTARPVQLNLFGGGV